jgi:hypothetical protein
VRPSFGCRRESSVSHIPSALDGSDEEKDANTKVKAALNDEDEDDDYFKIDETIPIDDKVLNKKVSANDKIQA